MKNSNVTQKFDKHIRSAIFDVVKSTAQIDSIEYSVDWSNFPNSLRLTCQYNADTEGMAPSTAQQEHFTKNILRSFLKYGIKFRDIRKNIEFI